MNRTPAARGVLLALLGIAWSAVACAQSAPPAPASDADVFGRGVWNLELVGQALSEAWNYNGSREELYCLQTGFMYGLRDDLALVVATPMFYVSQRGVDALAVGLTAGVRKRVARSRKASLFMELALGGSYSEISIPPRGTRFNYLFAPALGATVAIAGRGHLIAGVRWVHISNASLAGPNHNPDIEALGLHAGILLPF